MTPGRRPTRWRPAAVVALALVILVMPFGGGFPLSDDPYPHYRAVPWLDIALFALIVTAAPVAIAQIRDRRMGAATAVWGAIVVLLVASWAFQPSALGAQTLVRVAGMFAVAVVLRDAGRDERALVTGALAVVVLFEVALGVVQAATGSPTDMLGVAPGLSPIRGNVMVARGTFVTEYVFAGLGLVASGIFLAHGFRDRAAPIGWSAIAAVAILAVGMSFSRTALAGAVAGCAVLLPRARSSTPHRIALVLLVLGIALPALVLRDTWLARAEEGASPSQQAVTERVALASESLTLIAEHPLLGVGTGRYAAAIRERFPDDPRPHAVHDVPLQLAAEGGVLAGMLAVGLALVLAWAAWRGGPAALALFVMYVPAFLVDVYPYVAAQGTILTGLWIGAIDAYRDDRRER